MGKIFIINSRFLVDSSRHLLEDLETQKKSRLEPRLIKLLCLLCDHRETLVSREFLTKEIWNAYGGVDEGLSQAISFLRKALSDEKKQIIETIPKNGYILHAVVQECDRKIPRLKKTGKTKYVPLLVAACLGGLIFIVNQRNAPSNKGFKKEIKEAKMQMKSEVKKNKKAISSDPALLFK
jgi:DNA-binding winged helix-turn-helix (wHTH) protein